MEHFANADLQVQSWYPIARSEEFKRGKAELRDILGRKIAVYRGESGKVFALEGRCPHLGAMLGEGDVIGDDIRCPFHHWKYDGTGKCVAIPYKDDIPVRAKTFAYPVEEKYGVIWLFFGERPLFDVPHFLDEKDRDPYRYRPAFVNVHPHLILPNSIDLNHWSAVHGIQVVESSPFQILSPHISTHRMKGVLIEPPQSIPQKIYKFFGKTKSEWVWTSWGGNVATIDVRKPFVLKFMLCYRPLPGRGCAGQTLIYFPRRNAFMRWTGLHALLNAYHLMFISLLFADDFRIMRSIEFWPHLTKEDSMIGQWINHILKMPTFNPDQTPKTG
jgi:phenylpropionate dioxygenase-like ring-hydroxylating dioxygenase large terminal subunit